MSFKYFSLSIHEIVLTKYSLDSIAISNISSPCEPYLMLLTPGAYIFSIIILNSDMLITLYYFTIKCLAFSRIVFCW